MNENKITHKTDDGTLLLEENHCTYDNGETDLSWTLWSKRTMVTEIIGRVDKLYDQEHFKLVLSEDTSYRDPLKQIAHMLNYFTSLEQIFKDIENAIVNYKKEILPNFYKTQMVQDCQSIKELIDLLIVIEPVQGSKKEYSAEKLKEKILTLDSYVDPNDLGSGVSFNIIPWRTVTRTHGLRAKCMELLWYKKRGF